MVAMAAEFGARVPVVAATLDDDLGATPAIVEVVMATALDHDLLSAGDRRRGNANSGDRRNNQSKLFHSILSPPVEWEENIEGAGMFRRARRKILNRRSAAQIRCSASTPEG